MDDLIGPRVIIASYEEEDRTMEDFSEGFSRAAIAVAAMLIAFVWSVI